MYLNGVILVSPTELGIDSGDGRRAGPLGAALRLPYFTAAAWYHNKLPSNLQRKDLTDLLPIVEDYAINELMPVIAKGGYVTQRDREEAASRMAQYSGISKASILSYNLDVPTSFFWKELLREEGIPLVDWIQDIRELIKQKGVNAPILIQSLPPGCIRLHQQ